MYPLSQSLGSIPYYSSFTLIKTWPIILPSNWKYWVIMSLNGFWWDSYFRRYWNKVQLPISGKINVVLQFLFFIGALGMSIWYLGCKYYIQGH